MSYQFLSDEWFAFADSVADEVPEPLPALQGVSINLSIKKGPSGTHPLASLQSGRIKPGHAEAAEAEVTMDYNIARAMFVEGKPDEVLGAFMGGAITVQGDVAKLMALQATMSTPEQAAFQAKVAEHTE